MSVLWYARRLSRMSPGEIVRRSRDGAVKLLWKAQWAGSHESPSTAYAEAPPLRSLLRCGTINAVQPGARARLLAVAEELIQGRWSVFEVVRDDLIAPDWFLDPHSGRQAPRETFAFSINHRDVGSVGDPKYVWELSRHQHLSVLAAAYFLTGDERYSTRTMEQLTSWWKQNPFLSGIHWTSGIELGVRLISWVWIRRLLDASPSAREGFERNPLFLDQLWGHQRYLGTFSSHDSSGNNHLIAEAAGQFAASCAFPYFSESETWREGAAKTLRRELPRQTFLSGLNREQASDYHGFVLELCLAAALEGEAAGHSLGAETWTWIRRMVDALASVVDTACHPPRQGDSDDAWGLLLDSPDFDRWSSLLATGSHLFGDQEWWPPVSHDDVRTPLWAGLAAAPSLPAARPIARANVFPDAGLAILRDRAGTPDEIWCSCDFGPLGFLSIAGHGHADALAIECRYGGIQVFADPGTFCYYGDAGWRTYFRSTVAHNTLQLAELDQSVPGGPFLWQRHARTSLVEARGLDDGPVAVWSAEHDGYARLRPPAIHRRTVELDRAQRRITMTDEVRTAGVHTGRLVFHLGPTIEVELCGTRARLSWPGTHGTATMELPAGLEWRTARGQIDPPSGVVLGGVRQEGAKLDSRRRWPAGAGHPARHSPVVRAGQL